MKISELRTAILFLDNTSTCAHVACLCSLYCYIWHSNDVTRFGGTTVLPIHGDISASSHHLPCLRFSAHCSYARQLRLYIDTCGLYCTALFILRTYVHVQYSPGAPAHGPAHCASRARARMRKFVRTTSLVPRPLPPGKGPGTHRLRMRCFVPRIWVHSIFP